MADEHAGKRPTGIPGVDFLPPLPAPTHASDSTEHAKLQKDLAAKSEELLKVQSDLRVAQFTIQQLESEITAISARHLSSTQKGGKSKKKKKKAKKGKKNSKSKSPDTTDEEPSAGAEAEDEHEGEDISYEDIADRLPGVSLALVLAAEKQFASADLDGSGTLDAQELDEFLTKNNQIYSEQQIKNILHLLDAHGDDRIDFLEYVSILHLLQNPEEVQRRRKAMDPKSSAMLGSLQFAVNGSKACVLQ